MPLGTLFINYYTTEFSNYKKAVIIAQNEARTNNARRYVVPSEKGFRVRKDPPEEGTENVTVVETDGHFRVPPALYDQFPV